MVVMWIMLMGQFGLKYDAESKCLLQKLTEGSTIWHEVTDHKKEQLVGAYLVYFLDWVRSGKAIDVVKRCCKEHPKAAKDPDKRKGVKFYMALHQRWYV